MIYPYYNTGFLPLRDKLNLTDCLRQELKYDTLTVLFFRFCFFFKTNLNGKKQFWCLKPLCFDRVLLSVHWPISLAATEAPTMMDRLGAMNVIRDSTYSNILFLFSFRLTAWNTKTKNKKNKKEKRKEKESQTHGKTAELYDNKKWSITVNDWIVLR